MQRIAHHAVPAVRARPHTLAPPRGVLHGEVTVDGGGARQGRLVLLGAVPAPAGGEWIRERGYEARLFTAPYSESATETALEPREGGEGWEVTT